MTEKLDSRNGVNDDGDVLSIYDYDTPQYPTEEIQGTHFDRVIPTDVLGVTSIEQVLTRKRLSARADHPALAGQSTGELAQCELREVVQTALDAYLMETSKLRILGATEERATRGSHYRDLMVKLTRAYVTEEEMDVILAQVGRSGVVPQQAQPIIAKQSKTPRDRPVYRDGKSAGGNDYN